MQLQHRCLHLPFFLQSYELWSRHLQSVISIAKTISNSCQYKYHLSIIFVPQFSCSVNIQVNLVLLDMLELPFPCSRLETAAVFLLWCPHGCTDSPVVQMCAREEAASLLRRCETLILIKCWMRPLCMPEFCYLMYVSDVFLYFSEELIMSRYINTQYEEKYLTFQRNILDTFNCFQTVLAVCCNRALLVVSWWHPFLFFLNEMS